MPTKRKPRGYWTPERIKAVAAQYDCKKDFSEKYTSAAQAAYRLGIMEEVCNHMTVKRKPKNYWTVEVIKEVAAKYDCRKDFFEKDSSAASKAWKLGIMTEVCSHMKRLGDLHSRGIYVLINERLRKVYVGLTLNFVNRKSQHFSEKNKCNSTAITHLQDTYFEELTEYVPAEEAVRLEKYYIDFYKESGYEVLNKDSAVGALGSVTKKWVYDACSKEALVYQNRTDFRKGSNGAYNSARKNGWLDKICTHMVSSHKPHGYWNYENCKKLALSCKTYKEFLEKGKGAIDACNRYGWLEDMKSHWIEIKKPNGYWTYEIIYEEARNCKTLKEFRENYPQAYQAAGRERYLPKLCKDLNLVAYKPTIRKWTLEAVHEEAIKYNTKVEFSKGASSAYSTAKQRGWVDKVCSHMKMLRDVKPKGYWDSFENCAEVALTCKNRARFQKKSQPAYNSAKQKGWLDIFFPK